MTKKRWRFFLILFLVLMFTSILGYEYYYFPSSDRRLRYGMMNTKKKIDLFHTREENIITIYRHVVEPLFTTNDRHELVPLLLESMPTISDDHLSYHFTLKPNVYFHNGVQLKSDDVYFLFLRMFLPTNPSVYHALYSNIEGCDEVLMGYNSHLSGFEIINDLEFVITLKQVDTQFLYYLSMPYAGIFSHTAYIEDPYQWGVTFLVGTGAYRYDGSQVRDHQVVLRRFGAYHGLGAYLPQIEFIWYDSHEEILQAYRQGLVDMAPLPITYLENFKHMPGNHRIVASQPDLPLTLFFNVQDSLLKDKRIRQAISYAINRDAIHDRYAFLGKDNVTTFLTQQMFGGDMTSQPDSYKLERAKALMSEAGFPNGLRLVVYYHDADEKEIWQILQGQLLEINVQLILFHKDSAYWYESMQSGELSMMLFSLEMLHPRGRDLFYRLFHSTQNRKWSINLDHEQLDQWIDTIRTSNNSYEIAQINSAIEEMLLNQEFLMLPVTFLPHYYIMRGHLQYEPSSKGYHLFNAASFSTNL